MMLNKIPPNATMDCVLSHLESAKKYGSRDRALFALRQLMRIRHISGLLVSDVVGFDRNVRDHFISEDGIVYVLNDVLRFEIHRYLLKRFGLKGNSLKPLLDGQLQIPLFPTQKRNRFSNNTLAQHFSYLDKGIWHRFAISKTARSGT